MAAELNRNAVQFYPWQQAQAQHWLQQRERFSHAWLIHGLAGIGKVQFAKAGAAALLCEQSQAHLACGQCASCQWLLSGNHPDLRLLRPDALSAVEQPDSLSTSRAKSPSKEIRVEQLRELHTWFNTATHRGGYRVAIIYPAERLNMISANALLKVLEEPPKNTVLLLIADQYERLLPTIISRCRRLALATPDYQQSVDWLAAQMEGEAAAAELWLAAVGGAPVAAYEAFLTHAQPYPDWLVPLCQQWAQGQRRAILHFAPQLEAQATSQWLEVLQRLYVDLQLSQVQLVPRYYPSLAPMLQPIVERSSAQALQQQWRWLTAQKRHADHPLNAKLLVHTALERMAHH